MKDVKRFVAALAILAVATMSIIVAFRLAPETWAVIAGLLFGVVAALPMCGVVVLLLRRQPAAPQEASVAPAPPQVILLQAGGAVPPAYPSALAPHGQPLLLPVPPAYARPVRAWNGAAPDAAEPAEDTWAGATAYAAPVRQARTGPRILGQ